MATNIELKARCADPAGAETRAIEFGAQPHGLLTQIDTYFRVKDGRLKVREILGERAELIQYQRANHAEIRKSNYAILVLSPEQGTILLAQLAESLGILTVIKKRRQLLMWNGVRIHLDRVENLGHFIEFEGLVGPTCSEGEAALKVEALTRALEIAAADQIGTSYSDLMLSR